MSSFFLRFHSGTSKPLPFYALFAASSLLAVPATAQTAPVLPVSSSIAPQLTGEVRPASSIAFSQRALPRLGRRDSRWLLSSMPDVAEKGSSQVQPVVTASPAPTPVARAVVTPAPAPVMSTTVTKPRTTVAVTSQATSPVLAKVEPAKSAPRPARYAANLPARGGLVLNSGVEPADRVTPKLDPSVSSVDESQRVLLARLDADLARAQKRLDRAETRLSDGQRQLGSFTNVLQSAILEAGEDARGLHPFVRVAQRYLGTPYVWGGESARGFDCSGFIMRVMRDLGYKALPHSAAEQFNYGTPIAKGLLKPGDIVFFANTYKPGVSHVGIYLGKGRFIHAANSHVGTIVSHLNEPKWLEKYAGARRLIRIKS